MSNQEDQSFFAKAEEWFIEENLHIWLGLASLIAGCLLVFVLHTEHSKNQELMRQNIQLGEQLIIKDTEIASLKSQIINQAVVESPPQPIEATINKTANKLQSKIDKVQTSVINNRPVLHTTDVKIVEKEAQMNNELKSIMLKSFCHNMPEDPSCKGKAK